MAVSVSIVAKNAVGNQYEVVADITFDSSYPTGGELVGVNEIFGPAFGAGVVTTMHYIDAQPRRTGATHFFAYDYANSKLLAYTAAMATEVTNATDLSAAIVRVRALGGKVTG